MGNFVFDGMVGFYCEFEGSYYVVKEIWLLVQIKVVLLWQLRIGWWLDIENVYDFMNLSECSVIIEGVYIVGYGVVVVCEIIFKKEVCVLVIVV